MNPTWLRCSGLLAGCAFFLPVQAYNISAAQNAAASNASCKNVANSLSGGFYWEIGDASHTIVGGTRGNNAPDPAQTPLHIDSASKWLFGAYVLEKRGGLSGLQAGNNGGYTNSDVAYLQMGNGYDNLNNLTCTSSDTIASCYGKGSNSTQTASDIGKFYYSGGEFLAMANNSLNLGSFGPGALGTEIGQTLGVSVSYVAPNPAASAVMSSSQYVQFLRRILDGSLKMHDALSADSWCTNAGTYGGLLGTKYKYCPTQSSTPPMPNNISFAYGLAHWIETDPDAPGDGGVPGDGAFNSIGASGFYPWIDASVTYYGVIAPAGAEPLFPPNELAYQQSVLCGQAIRQAFLGP